MLPLPLQTPHFFLPLPPQCLHSLQSALSIPPTSRLPPPLQSGHFTEPLPLHSLHVAIVYLSIVRLSRRTVRETKLLSEGHSGDMFGSEVLERTSRHEDPTFWSCDKRNDCTFPRKCSSASRRLAKGASTGVWESTTPISFSEHRHGNRNITTWRSTQAKTPVGACDKSVYVFKSNIFPTLRGVRLNKCFQLRCCC